MNPERAPGFYRVTVGNELGNRPERMLAGPQFAYYDGKSWRVAGLQTNCDESCFRTIDDLPTQPDSDPPSEEALRGKLLSTVGKLREVMEGIPDDAIVLISEGPDWAPLHYNAHPSQMAARCHADLSTQERGKWVVTAGTEGRSIIFPGEINALLIG